jgi:hypothetical protein
MKNIVIATPSYKNTVTVQYMQSIIDYLSSSKFRIMHKIYPGDSLVSRARNAIFSDILNNVPDFDYMVWQDDDVAADRLGIEKIIELGHDAIALSTPLKYPVSAYGVRCAVVGVYEDCGNFLYKTDFAGFGLFSISRKACLDIAEYCEKNNLFYIDDHGNRTYDVFRVGVNSANIYESEDFYVCSLLRKLGYDIYVDSSTRVSHEMFLREPLPINPQSIGRNYKYNDHSIQEFGFWTPNDWGSVNLPLY